MVVVFHPRHTVGSARLTCSEYPRVTRGSFLVFGHISSLAQQRMW